MGSNVTPIGIIEAAAEEACVVLPAITEIIPATEAINGNHNNLDGIQGGKPSERFHLTYAQYLALDSLDDFADTTLFFHKAGNETATGRKTFTAGIQVSGPSTYITAGDTGAQLLLSADANVDITGGTYITLGAPIITLNSALTLVTGTQDIIVRQSNGQLGKVSTANFYSVSNPNNYTANSGTVTSVGLTVPTGLASSTATITESGIFGITYQSGYSIPLTADTVKGVTAYSWGDHNLPGYITGFTEIDPTVPAYSKTLTAFSVIKVSTDALYEPLFSKNTAFNKNFGSASGTVAEGNDSRINNGQTAFGWGNHTSLYSLLGHTHTTSDITNLSSYTGFDARYYTESETYSKTEIQAFYSASVAISGYNKANWDTSYTYSQVGHIPLSQIGIANGIVPLDGSVKISSIYLPSYVDDVAEVTNFAALPVTGESGKIYVTLDTNKTYRWSGTVYVEISPSDVNSVNGQTGIVALTTTHINEGTNEYYTNAKVLAYGDTQWVQLDGTYNNPSWLNELVWTKITGTPTTIVGYGITDGLTTSSISATSPIFYTSGVISSQIATSGQHGYLTSTDWTTFNNKQPALSGTGFVKITGTTISYDNSTYLTSSTGITSVTGTSNQITVTGTTTPIISLPATITGITSFTSAGINVTGLTADRVVTTDGSKNLASSSVTSTELGYLSGVTSAVQTQLGLKADLVGGLVPSNQLPSYVDDVLEYATLLSLPATGVSGVIYITADTSKTYRWTGSVYAEMSGGTSASARTLTSFTATAAQTTFSIPLGYVVGLVDVFVNGIKLAVAEFTATNGTTVVLAEGAELNDIVEIFNYNSAFTANNALRLNNVFTATAAQTTFTVTYTPGLIDVFYNGAKLVSTEYTATNGTSVVLSTACLVNDIVEIIVYSYSVSGFSGIGGSGTSNKIVKFSTSNSIIDSNITDDGSLITFATPVLGTGATFNGVLTVGAVSNISKIAFPGSFNDAGSITHEELTSDVSVMKFSVSDNSVSTDYFAFGSAPSGVWTEGVRITANGALTALTGTFTDGSQGLIIKGYGSGNYGGIYSTSVTPGASNYSLLTNNTQSILNASTSSILAVGGTGVLAATATAVTLSQALTGTSATFSGVAKAASFNTVLVSSTIPFTTWTTLYTIPSGGGIYFVSVGLDDQSYADWHAHAIIYSSGIGCAFMNQHNSTLIQLRLTGMVLEIFQNGGSPSIALQVRVFKMQ